MIVTSSASMPEGFEGISLPILARLFDSMPHGVIVLDEASRVVIYNSTEERLAGRKRERVLGRDFFRDVAPCMNVPELGGEFRASIGRRALDVRVELSLPLPHLEQPRDVVVRMRSFASGGAPFGVLVLEDVSLERSIARMREALGGFLVHDLKNPLAAVLANLEFVASGDRLAPDAREAIQDAQDSARRLHRMLVNLLDITRLETSVMPVNRTPTNLGSVVRAVVAENQAVARFRNVTIEADLPAAPVVDTVDPDLIGRVLHNLAENAVRYARTRAVVAVEATPSGTILRVGDDGPGIPDPVRSSIFDKFVQVQAGSSGSPNRGLGLTFARLATRAHGGEISVACPPRGGCVFQVELPRRRPAPASPNAPHAH